MKQVIIGARKERGVDNDNMGFLEYIFGRKVLDETIDGYDAEKIKDWLGDIERIDSFKYFYYASGSKFYSDKVHLKNQPTKEVLSKLETHFSESLNVFTQIQHKVYSSGKQEIILRGMSTSGETTKLAVLKLKSYQTKQ